MLSFVIGFHFNFFITLLLLRAYLKSWPGLSFINFILTFEPILIFDFAILIYNLAISIFLKFLLDPILYNSPTFPFLKIFISALQ